MGNVFCLENDQTMEMLGHAIRQRIPAIMTYLSKNKWHVAKVVFVRQDSSTLHLETMHQDQRHQPLNIQVGQPVGLSFKHSYAKFVFDTTVQALHPSHDSVSGGTLIVDLPEKMEAIQRRSYFRVNVPESMRVNVVLWHRTGRRRSTNQSTEYYNGSLIDLSAGGAQLAVPLGDGDRMTFRKGQFICLRFTPLPYEMPLMINAQIRNVLPTADDNSLCLGLQLVGLEASPEGRETLTRIAHVVETYYHMNQGDEMPEAGHDTMAEQHAEMAYRTSF